MRIPLLRGRLFTDADRAGAENVMIVGAETARTIWPDGNPIGARVKIGGTDGPWRTVIGVAGDVRHRALAEPPDVQMYLPQAQVTDSNLTFVVRTSGDPSLASAPARAAIQAVGSDLPVFEVAPLEDLVARSAAPRRFVMVLLELFGGLALLLTAVGVYGVISYAVAERTREIGLRAALGATPRDIVSLVIGHGLAIVAAGLAAGIGLALATTRYLQGSLYEVSAMDPPTFASVAAVLLAVAAVALSAPVVRALRVDPAVALRQD
jgi:putative ABC transport system permease protein